MTFGRGILVLAVSSMVAAPVFSQPQVKGGNQPLPDGALWRLGTTQMRHLGEIRQVGFTPDGKHVASVGEDHVFALWDVKTGNAAKSFPLSDKKLRTDLGLNAETIERLLHMGRRHYGFMQFYDTSAELGADGKSLVISNPGKTRVLDLLTGRETAHVAFKDNKPGFVVISANGKWLARFTMKEREERSTELVVVEIAGGKELHKLKLSPGEHFHLMCFSPDGKYFAAANAANHIGLWDLSTGKRVRRYEMQQTITALAFTPRGDKLASASTHGIFFWDFASEEETAKLPLEEAQACTIAFSPDGSLLASTGQDNSVLIWDLAKATTRHQLTGLPALVSALAFSADGKQLASATIDGTLHLWNLTTMQQTTPVEHRPVAKPIAYFAHDRLLVKSGKETALQQIEAATGKVLKVLTLPTIERRGTFAIAPNGLRSAHADQEHGFVLLWDNEKNVETHKLEGHGPAVTVMNFSPDSTLLATLSYDKNLRIWNPATGKQIRNVETPVGLPVEERMIVNFGRFREERTSSAQVAFSADNRSLAVLGINGIVSFLELATGKERGRFRVGATPINQLILSPDGRLMATLSSDDVVRVWDTLTGKLAHGFVHDGDIKAVAFSASSKLLAVGGANGTVALYDLVQDKMRRRFTGHRAAINGLFFAPNGGPLFSSGEDGVMHFWDVNAPPIVEPLAETPGDVRLAKLWAQLGHAEAAEGARAINELIAHPNAAVKLLQQKLKPAAPVEAARVEKLLAELRSSNYTVREKASEELGRLDMQVMPALGGLLRDKLSTETKRRVEKIVETLDAQRASEENLRAVRAVEVLERIGTAETTSFLKLLAGGAPHACLTNSAKEVLLRNR